MQWAYTALGRLKHHDMWDWFGPATTSWYDPLTTCLHGGYGLSQPPAAIQKLGTSVIGFDGTKWIAGYMGQPSSLLDAAKHSPERYAYDVGNRPIRWLHSFVSDSADFPESIPLVDAAGFKELHEKYAVPLFDKSIANPDFRFERTPNSGKTLTAFELARRPVALTEHLPADAIAALKKAHAEGKPIGIHYNAATKEWSIPPTFNQDIGRQMAQVETYNAGLKADAEAKHS